MLPLILLHILNKSNGPFSSWPDELQLYLMEPIKSGGTSYIWWKRLYLAEPVISVGTGYIWWNRLYLVKPFISGGIGYIWWNRLYLVEPILSGGTSYMWWNWLYLVELDIYDMIMYVTQMLKSGLSHPNSLKNM